MARDLELAPAGATDSAAAEALSARVRELLAKLPLRRSGSLIKREDYARIANDALTEAHGMYAVPRYMDARGCEAILTGMLAYHR